MKIKLFETSIIKFIHLRKIIIIFSYLKTLIKTHHLTVFDFRNFFFKFNEINSLIVYAHLINMFTKKILFQNKFNRLIKISRNYHLKKFIKLKFINVYYIDNGNNFKNRNFAAKQFRSKYRKINSKKSLQKLSLFSQ